MVPMLRKHAASANAIGEREAKWTRSLRPSVASPVFSLPVADATEQARQSEEWACTHASLGPVLAHDSQSKDPPFATSIGASRPRVAVTHKPGRSQLGRLYPQLK